jgi:uracil-DNA glycosylase
LKMKRIIFIGQAMPRKKSDLHDWPSLNKWLFSIGLTQKTIVKYTFYSALVDYFPGAKNGSHKIPSHKEIYDGRERLKHTIKRFNPKIVVPVGRLSIAYCLNQCVQPLSHNIGKKYSVNPYLLLSKKLTVIPLPHPSGASTLRFKKENRLLLNKALQLLKKEMIK